MRWQFLRLTSKPPIVLASIESSEPDDSLGLGHANAVDGIQDDEIRSADVDLMLRAELKSGGDRNPRENELLSGAAPRGHDACGNGPDQYLNSACAERMEAEMSKPLQYVTRSFAIVVLTVVLSVAWTNPSAFAGQTGGSLTPLIEHIVNPQATDPTIDQALDDHYAWIDPTAPTNHQLFVYMPGTGGVPATALLIQQKAARLGYHVIGLMYVDDRSIQFLCVHQPDPSACSYDARFEILTGQDVSPLVDVNQPNSIDNRLTKLLQYLDANYPEEGWSEFLADGMPLWSQIATGGFSQGGAEGAFIAKLRVVARVVMFSAPVENYGGAPPSWESTAHVTPSARYWGLAHDRDPFYQGILGGWTALGMDAFGDKVQVETSAPPYGFAHELFIDLLPQRGGFNLAHPSTVIDIYTPLFPDKTPMLADAWQYMLTAGGQ